MKKTKTLLITGASGLLGMAVTKLMSCCPDYEVFAVISGRRQVEFPRNVHVVSADLLREEDRARVMHQVKPTHMFHFAWGLENAGFLKDENNITWLDASLHLLRLFITGGGKRFVFSGSSSEYGYGNEICQEKSPVHPRDLYGAAKLSFNNIASVLCPEQQVEYVSARIFSIYGENDDRPGTFIPTAIQNFLDGKPMLCKAPRNVWDYIYIDDAAAAMVKIMDSPYCGTVNVASGIPHEMEMVGSVIAREINAEHLLRINKANTTKAILLADTSVLNNVIGFQCKTGFEEGISHCVQWWKTKRRTIK